MNRRKFLKTSATTLAALPLLPLANSAFAKGVDLNDPTVKALGYIEIATDAVRPDKMGTAGADQLCSNCRFYSKSDDVWGGCSLFRNELVKGDGWCKGWVPMG